MLLVASPCWAAAEFELISYNQNTGTQTTGLASNHMGTFLRVAPTPSKKTTNTSVYHKLITKDGYETGYYFFNRNSPTLVIVGPGILNKADNLVWFAEKFSTYDIAVMDFRCNKDMGNFLWSSDTLTNPKKALLYNVARDVSSIINHAMLPRHTTLVGYGYCYGGWIFSLFQAFEPTSRRFDYLIFDSLPQSLERLLNNIMKDADVMGPRNPNKKPGLFQKFAALPIIRKPIIYLATQAVTDFSITSALATITIPVLFIQGKLDRVASLEQFQNNFKACGSAHKYALLTPCEHVENFKHASQICAGVCFTFIEGTLSDSLSFEHINN